MSKAANLSSFSAVTRFAPSPTGMLHTGHILNAFMVWAGAMLWNAKVLLRMENHDSERCKPEYAQAIQHDMCALGFTNETSEWSFQSDKSAFYQGILDHLYEQGLVYACRCSRKTLRAFIQSPTDKEYYYTGKCRTAGYPMTTNATLRLVIPSEWQYSWKEYSNGLTYSEQPSLQCGDMPLRDNKGNFTYQFCVVADDIQGGVSHVIRGEDLRSSTARQVYLWQLLTTLPPPIYYHHQLILGTNGEKLSKKDGAIALRDILQQGISKEQLFGRVLQAGGITKTAFPLTLAQGLEATAEYISTSLASSITKM